MLLTVSSLVILSISTLIFLFVPVIFPCNIDGCAGPEEVYAAGMGAGLLCALISAIVAVFTIRGVRLLVAVTAVLQLGIWFLIGIIWGS